MKSCELKNTIDIASYTKAGLSFSDITKHYLETGKIPSPLELRTKKKRMSDPNLEVFYQTKN
jgi:hypothetical protein